MRKHNFYKLLFHLLLIIPLLATQCRKEDNSSTNLHQIFQNPPQSAKPWVFWYWLNASVSKAGITADLEAMKEAGIGGAYLMTIYGAKESPLYEPQNVQLTPEWWEMIKFAFHEADRLGIDLAIHASDGFAVAGGPWITPELSMQKVVWSDTIVEGGKNFRAAIKQPETKEGYYKDIAVFAFPTPKTAHYSTNTIKPVITTSLPGVNAGFLAEKDNKETFKSSEPCWIQYAFDEPFTCRNITVKDNGNNYQAQRLEVQVSDDGVSFRSLGRLEPPRHGWQNWDADVTHAVEPATSRFFRFVYDPAGSEPGSEDLDAAKWKPSLRIRGIELSGTPKIHQFEGKTGEVWRITNRTSSNKIAAEDCIPADKLVDLTSILDASGSLNWDVPEGEWTILRIGHTSTGHTNYTGGGGLGLECDKFNPVAIKTQFDGWFGKIAEQVGPEMATRVLKIFHVDSWECGSQNWSPVFAEEFRKRRGYDLRPYLPVMAGIPVGSAETSEKVLYDVRQTIAELVNDKFYGVMAELAKQKGYLFSAEAVSPTMTSDGMLHYQSVDIPMGEFWFRSPTHDKPNDMMDAISGAHIYGKQLVQAESFTSLRIYWNEHPAMLKALGDRNFALGINRLALHVYMQSPWTDRKPGITLNGVGLYFQRDQTWWKPGRAWMEYLQRCQALLQQGRHVADIAVFTGEEIPRRAVLPDRLVSTLPGIFGKDVLEREKQRLANTGQPMRKIPDDVTHSANMADPEKWIDPLKGYTYDSFNKDVLLKAKVKDGRIELPGGASYALLILPDAQQMTPNSQYMSPEVAEQFIRLVSDGAKIVISKKPVLSPSLQGFPGNDQEVEKLTEEVWGGIFNEIKGTDGTHQVKQKGKGMFIMGPVTAHSFAALGIEKDFLATEGNKQATDIAWTHRSGEDFDLYFVSNQKDEAREINISLTSSGKLPELFDPLTGETMDAKEWKIENGRTMLPLRLEGGGSIFIVLQKSSSLKAANNGRNWQELKDYQTLTNKWKVTFNPKVSGPSQPVEFTELQDWSRSEIPAIKYYSGTAVYETSFTLKEVPKQLYIDLGEVANLAEVKVNGISCGISWTAPYRLNISKAVKAGENTISIEVTNTWANRIMGDQLLPEKERVTWTNAPFRIAEKPLLKAGLLGPVKLVVEKSR